jgi:ketopantoate reductase
MHHDDREGRDGCREFKHARQLRDVGVACADQDGREYVVADFRGLAVASLFRSGPGSVERRSAFDRIVIGELDRMPRERTHRIVDAFAAAGVAGRVSDDIGLDL